MADVFISYAHKDLQRALPIAQYLRDAGWDVWMDVSDLHPMERFTEEIAEGIRGCSVFLFLYSKAYHDSRYCGDEFGYAADACGKTLACAILDGDCPWVTSRFAFHFGSMTVPGFGNTADTEEELRALAEQITNSHAFLALREFREGNGEGPMPALRYDDLPMLRLRSGFETARAAAQGYGEAQSYDELLAVRFLPEAAQEDADDDAQAQDRTARQGERPLLLQELVRENSAARLVLSGSGGLGKTVSLLQYGETLLNVQPVLFVRLADVRFGAGTGENQLGCIEQYVRKRCVEESTWTYLTLIGRRLRGDGIRVTLLLDGFNELPAAAMRLAEREIAALARDWPYADIVVTTRSASLLRRDELTAFEFYEAVALSENRIRRYLNKQGFQLPSDEGRLTALLCNPLRLRLFLQTQPLKALYSRQPGLEDLLHEQLNTAGKLMDAYLASQLYRFLADCAPNEETKPQLTAVALGEVVYPFLAWRMFASDAFTLAEAEAQNAFRRPEDAMQAALSDFARRRAGDLCWDYGYTSEEFRWQPREAFNAFRNVNLMPLVEQPDGTRAYTFPHQTIRDYFAARYLALLLRTRPEEAERLLKECALPDELVALLSDVLEEERARPYCEPEKGWVFPGKRDGSRSASEFSLAERTLDGLRGKSDEGSRSAVRNLFEILRYARGGRLAQCCFDGLDLRGCRLRNTKFSLWFRDALHSCSFDGAWLDMSDFSLKTHRSYVNALCVAGEKRLLSGDSDGVILETDCSGGELTGRRWSLPEEGVRALAFDQATGRIAAATAQEIFELDPAGDKVSLLGRTELGWIRKLRFSSSGEPEYCIDTMPFVWWSLDGRRSGEAEAPDWLSGAWDCSGDGNRYWRSGMRSTVYSGCRGDDGNWTEIDSRFFELFPPHEAACIFMNGTLRRLQRQFDALREAGEDSPAAEKARQYAFSLLSDERWNDSLVRGDAELSTFRQGMLTYFQRDALGDRDRAALASELEKELRAFLSLLPDAFGKRISAIAAHPSGERVLVAVWNIVAELDAQLHLLRRIRMRYSVNSLCYLPGNGDGAYAAVGSGMDVVLLDEDLTVHTEARGAPPLRLRAKFQYENGTDYLILSDGTMRLLDAQHRVKRVRKLTGRGARRVVCAADGSGLRIVYPTDLSRWKSGALYDFETDQFSPLGERYSLPPNEGADKQVVRKLRPEAVYYMDRKMRIVPKNDPDAYTDVPYRGGLCVFGCSFRELRGVREEDKQMLYWNGGDVE